MNNKVSDRQQAIKLQSVAEIYRILGRSHDWFHAWWHRYRALAKRVIRPDKTKARPRLSGLTPAQHRKHTKLCKLPLA